MHPSYQQGGPYDDFNIATHSISQTWHQKGKCPENTIPIRRTKEEDVLRASSFRRYGKKTPRSMPTNFIVNDPEANNVTIGHLVQNSIQEPLSYNLLVLLIIFLEITHLTLCALPLSSMQ
jgi:hypothetical protein